MAKDSENGEAAATTRPDDTQQGQGGAIKSLVQVESLIQLALVLPIPGAPAFDRAIPRRGTSDGQAREASAKISTIG